MYFFKKNTFFLSLAFNLLPLAYSLLPIAYSSLASVLSPITYNLITSKLFTFALLYGRYTLT